MLKWSSYIHLLLFSVLLCLKIGGVIGWNWIWIFLPIMAAPLTIFSGIILVVIVELVIALRLLSISNKNIHKAKDDNGDRPKS